MKPLFHQEERKGFSMYIVGKLATRLSSPWREYRRKGPACVRFAAVSRWGALGALQAPLMRCIFCFPAGGPAAPTQLQLLPGGQLQGCQVAHLGQSHRCVPLVRSFPVGNVRIKDISGATCSCHIQGLEPRVLVQETLRRMPGRVEKQHLHLHYRSLSHVH